MTTMQSSTYSSLPLTSHKFISNLTTDNFLKRVRQQVSNEAKLNSVFLSEDNSKMSVFGWASVVQKLLYPKNGISLEIWIFFKKCLFVPFWEMDFQRRNVVPDLFQCCPLTSSLFLLVKVKIFKKKFNFSNRLTNVYSP